MDQWLTFRETCMELRLGGRAVLSLLRRGQLVGIRLPKRGGHRFGAWRILYPGPRLARHIEECKRHVEHVPLLSTREVAQVLEITPGAVRQLKKRRRLQGTKVGMSTLYSAAEIRHLLSTRERVSRQGSRQIYSPTLAEWARRLVKQEELVEVQVLDSLLRQAIVLPEPAKSRYIVEVWEHFDAINSLLRSARAREDIASAVKKAGPKKPVPGPEIDSLADAIEFLNKTRSA